MTINLEELRGLTEAELAQKATALKQQLFQLRVQAKLGRLEKGHELRVVRRDIARVLTIQRVKAAPSAAPVKAAKTTKVAKTAKAAPTVKAVKKVVAS